LRFFIPQGRHVAPIGAKFDTDSSVTNFTPSVERLGYRTPKTETFTGSPQMSKFAKNCGFLATGSRHNEHIHMKLGDHHVGHWPTFLVSIYCNNGMMNSSHKWARLFSQIGLNRTFLINSQAFYGSVRQKLGTSQSLGLRSFQTF